jgi:nucleoside-diphosphate-sugar epimerase
VLELARYMKGLGHVIYASSSSVYGNDTAAPFSEDARADHPVSYYGATKRAGELLSHSYAELFGLPLTGLRFFTVYGPWGRPDMAYWLFTEAILKQKPLKLLAAGYSSVISPGSTTSSPRWCGWSRHRSRPVRVEHRTGSIIWATVTRKM